MRWSTLLWLVGPLAWAQDQIPLAPWDFHPDSPHDDVTVDPYISILRAVNYDLRLRNLKMINSGTSVQIVLPARLLNGPKLNGGLLPTTYRLTKMKFHWSHVDDQGSEHAIANKTFPLELQLIHLRGNRSMEQALRNRDGVAILSVLFTLSDTDNKEMNIITQKLPNIRFKDNWVQISNVMPRALLPVDTSNFFSYKGSLTAPPCSQVAHWSVYANPSTISRQQLEQFRKLFSKPKLSVADPSANLLSDKIFSNARPLQKVNGRKILLRKELYEPLPHRYGSHGSRVVPALPLLLALLLVWE